MSEKEVLCLERNLRNTVHMIIEIQIIGGIHILASTHSPPPQSKHSPVARSPGQSHGQALGDMAVLHISVSAWFAEHSGLYKIWVHSHLKQKYFLHYTFSLASFSGWRHEKRWTFLLTPESVNLMPERWCKAVITCNTDFNLLTKIFYFWYLILELPNKDAIAVFTWGQKCLTEREKCQLSPFLAAFPKNLSPAQVSGLYPTSLCSFFPAACILAQKLSGQIWTVVPTGHRASLSSFSTHQLLFFLQ